LLDLERLLQQVSVIVDVGAHVGESALPFARAFPEARVFAFEPVPTTFSTLQERTSNVPRIECFNLALGAYDGEATFQPAASSGHNSLLNVSEPGTETVTVRVTTGDAWAAAHDAERIDVLKIDTEGYEIEVLKGFDGLVRAGKVRSILAECEFDRVTPEPHTSFFELYEHLTGRGLSFATLYTDSVHSNRFAWGNALFLKS
jgi:FkbM family methyltransferase